MAHPYAEHRQYKVEKSRVARMTGGSAKHADVAADKGLIRSMVKPGALKMEGGRASGRLDKYARGGPVKKGSTNVNVIVAPQGGGASAAPPMPLPPPGIAAGSPPMPPPGGQPPMMQSRGGKAYATGGKVADGPAWKEGLKNGTQVQHSDGKNDGGDIYRARQITYATGGPVEAFGKGPKMTAGDNGEGRLQKRALQKRSKLP